MDELLIKIRQLLAQGNIKDALTLAESIQDEYWRGYALKWVSEAFAQSGKEEAIQIAQDIPVESLKNETLYSLSYIFSKNELFKLSVSVARMIRDPYLKKKAMRTISSNLAKVIITKGVNEIKLSELQLDERDIEELKPLPYGIIYKDKKLLVGSEVHPIKGELKHGILFMESRQLSKKLKYSGEIEKVAKKEDLEALEFLFKSILQMIQKGYLSEAYNLARNLEEPERSKLLEAVGIEHLKRGDLFSAESILEEAENADSLALEIFRVYLLLKKLKKAREIIFKIKDPSLVLLAVYEYLKVELTFEIFTVFARLSGYKFGRVIKFIAFEMLKESKESGDFELLKRSRKIFLLGKLMHKGIY
ncbi:hypothetical protein [Thermococcus sp.]